MSLRKDIEDGTVALLAAELLPANGGVVPTIKAYQGPLSPDENDPDVSRVTNGQLPAILVTTGDAEYIEAGMTGEIQNFTMAVHLIFVISNLRSAEDQARATNGAYELLEAARNLLHGRSPAASIGCLVGAREEIVGRGDFAIWRQDYSVSGIVDVPDLDAGDGTYDSRVVQVHSADFEEPDPIIETERDI